MKFFVRSVENCPEFFRVRRSQTPFSLCFLLSAFCGSADREQSGTLRVPRRSAVRNLLRENDMTLPRQVRGFLIDLDGTVAEAERIVPGVPEALALLQERNLPYRIVTNTTSKPRSAILAKLRKLGLELPSDAVITAPVIGREYLLRQGLNRCYPLLKGSLREDLEGIEFVEDAPQVVLVGDLGDELTYEALNLGFRFLLDKQVAFVTMARNRYFRGSDGLCLDVGATVAALEYATERTAVLIGKPAREFFLVACQSIGVPPEETIVIGDDLEADIGGALAAACGGVLVRTGKYRPEQEENSTIRPDRVIDSLADLPSLLGG
jgi:HAD superfamily hydrolase (TIGR01458 family)